jgi:predicted phosphate transport protein (TIGR00153 family)
MSTIGKLFGRSPFGQMKQHMEHVAQCVKKMAEALTAVQSGRYDSLDELAEEASQLEHQADEVKNDIRNRLLKRVFMPIDRSEVLEILSLQDSLADTAEDVCRVLTFKRLPIPASVSKDFNEFIEHNLNAFQVAYSIVRQLDELIESGFGGMEAERIRGLASQTAFAEHQADMVQVKLLKMIYSMESELSFTEFHLWMRLTNVLSEISNLSEDLAERVLKTLSLK